MTSERCRRCGEAFPPALEPGEFEGICPACLAGLATEAELAPSSVDPLAQAAKDPPPLKRGATFRGLEVLELIGQGGMGVVYKARQIELGRIVALKILSPRLAADPEFARRFTREAQALATLDHPHVVRVHDVGREADLCFLVMEYVDGSTLRDLLVRRALAPDHALRLVPQLCEALAYAHSRGVIHRDVKPENILVSRSGAAKIADFGLAKIVSADDLAVSTLTQTNVVMGTVNYMAPEQREGRREADHRADIYSLGVVFYELLTGELPVGRFDPPSRRRSVDARLDEVVLRALEKDPERRYQSARDFGRDVERLAGAAPAAADCPILDLASGRRLGTAPGRRFAARAVACPVTVRGWDRPEIGVRVDGDFQFDDGARAPLLQSQVDTRSIVLHLPAGADLDLSVDEGDVRLFDLRGSAGVRVADGALSVADHDGPLRIQAGRGRVSVDGLRSEYVEVRAREGSVELRGLTLARGRAQIEAEGGAVDIEAAAGSSFRYVLESRGGAIDGPASGQVGGGEGWLTARTGGGSLRLRAAVLPPLNWRDFAARLTKSDVERIGVYAIVNAGLFLFFGLVAGTVAPAVIVAVFWGMSLGLQLWKNYIQGTPGRSLTESVPGVIRKAMDLLPTPGPAAPPAPPPPPPPARTSALAVLALLFGLPAALAGAGSAIALVVERSPVFELSSYDAAAALLFAAGMGATAFAAGLIAVVIGLAAAGHVAESKGALKGRGLAQAAVTLAVASVLVAGLWVRPALRGQQQAAETARETAADFIDLLQERRWENARNLLGQELRGRMDPAALEGLADQLRKWARGERVKASGPIRLSGDRSSADMVCALESPRGALGYVRLPLAREGGVWRILEVDDFHRLLGGRP